MRPAHLRADEPRRRFPLAPLARICNELYRPTTDRISNIGDTGRVADVVGVHASLVHRWREDGLNHVIADRAAVALGMHPAEIWPEWFDEEDAA